MPAIRKLEDKAWLAALIVLLVIAGLIGLALHERNKIRTIPCSAALQEDLYEPVFRLDSLREDAGGNLVITGLFAEKGVTYSYYNFGIGALGAGVYNRYRLACADADTVYEFPTLLTLPAEPDPRLQDGINYKYAGFSAVIPAACRSLAGESLYVITTDPAGRNRLYDLGRQVSGER